MNPLMSEATRLEAGGNWQAQGYLVVYKRATQGVWNGKVIQLQLQFWSAKELGEAVAWAIANGYAPEQMNGLPSITQASYDPSAGNVPMCPDHNIPMRPSKKLGEYYCPKRVGGGFCKRKGSAPNAGGARIE